MQMAGIEGKSEFLAAADSFQCHFGAVEIKRDLSGMDLKGESDSALGTNVEDWLPLAGKRAESFLEFPPAVGGITANSAPQLRTCESADYADAEFLGRAKGCGQLFGGALTYPVRVAVAPNVIGEDTTMARLDSVANTLPDPVIGEDRGREIIS